MFKPLDVHTDHPHSTFWTRVLVMDGDLLNLTTNRSNLMEPGHLLNLTT